MPSNPAPRLLALTGVTARREGEIGLEFAPCSERAAQRCDLIRRIEVDDALEPPQLEGTRKLGKALTHAEIAQAAQAQVGGRRVVADPSGVLVVDLDPGVCVRACELGETADRVLAPAGEAVDEPRRQADRAREHDHPACEVLAVTCQLA